MADILKRARPELQKKGKVLTNLSYGEETELLENLAYKTDFKGVTVRNTNDFFFLFYTFNLSLFVKTIARRCGIKIFVISYL